jgi:hypothetical protein
MRFKIYEAAFGIKYNGVDYEFEHVDSLTIDDPESTRLTRGANSSNRLGLVYKEGLKEAKKWTVTIVGMSLELKAVLDTVFQKQERVDVYCISRIDGSSKMAKNAVLTQMPQQMTIDESPDSMNVSLIFESFDTGENHKT